MHTVSRHMWEIITALLYMQRNCYKPLIELSEWKGFVAWSKGRHFSPSLHGDRYLKLGFQSDLRAEISGSIVWYDALAPRPEALLSCCFDGACTVSLEKKFLLNCKVNHKQPSHCFKHHLLVRISSTWIIRYWPVRFQVTNPLIWHLIARLSNSNLSQIVVLMISYAYWTTRFLTLFVGDCSSDGGYHVMAGTDCWETNGSLRQYILVLWSFLSAA